MVKPLSSLLLLEAANNRHGVVFRPQLADLSKSDIPGIFHIGVPSSLSNSWESASGGVARNEVDATLAAIGEGVERYCAAIVQVPLKSKSEVPRNQILDAEEWTLFSQKQRSHNDFPFVNLYSEDCLYTNVYELSSKKEFWAPHPLVVLRDDYQTGIPSSSGLAAGPTATLATLRAVQELIERDSLMATWLHSLPARAIKTPPIYKERVSRLRGDISVFDLTPNYSPFPVVAVAGGIPIRGKRRNSLGVACRETLAEATDKAFLEWCQGVYFAGIYPKFVNASSSSKPDDVKSFDDHAIYYTNHPKDWENLPLLMNRKRILKPTAYGTKSTPRESLEKVVSKLSQAGIRLFYRDLSTIDALQSGVRVVRALSPDLIPINAHNNWPFVGGNAADIRLRYKWADQSTNFPNLFPHPLG